MTENEAIKKMSHDNTAYGGARTEEVRKTAIKALEEVQQYRAIGTPEECREVMKRSNEKTRMIDGITECCGYDFGTDAFRIELSKFCPVCGREIERNNEE